MVFRGFQMVFKAFHGFSKVFRGFQGFSDGFQGFSDGFQGFSDACFLLSQSSNLEPLHLNSQISSLTTVKNLKSQTSNLQSWILKPQISNLMPQIFNPELSNLKSQKLKSQITRVGGMSRRLEIGICKRLQNSTHGFMIWCWRHSRLACFHF